jgi:hypothetical protein
MPKDLETAIPLNSRVAEGWEMTLIKRWGELSPIFRMLWSGEGSVSRQSVLTNHRTQ